MTITNTLVELEVEYMATVAAHIAACHALDDTRDARDAARDARDAARKTLLRHSRAAKTPLYRALAKGVRKEDHAELARMLGMVDARMDGDDLSGAFLWRASPQGLNYWAALSNSLREAGYECW